MKVRCIDGSWSSNELTTGKEYEVLSEMGCYYQLKINDKGIRYQCYVKSRFEVINEDNKTEELSEDERDFVQEIIDECLKEKNKMEKTFREVIADIKEGEIWENEIYSISKDADGLSIKRLDKYIQKDIKDTPYMYLYDKTLFELQRKQYTFEEAFKAYEEGKEIESCENGYKYLQNTFTYPGNEQWLCFRNSEQMFTTDAIRGKWYIND